MISSTSAWFFFVLLNAYYGGALTMFFTSQITIPFESIEDVMESYPTWKLKMMVGNDVYFQYKALEGNKLYQEFWDRVKNKPSEAIYQTMADGLLQLRTDSVILHAIEGQLIGHFKANPFLSQNIKTFGKGRVEYFSAMLPKNSPLTPLFRKVQLELIESGTVEYLEVCTWKIEKKGKKSCNNRKYLPETMAR